MSQFNRRLQPHELYYNLGWVWQQQSQFQLAVANYRKALLLSKQVTERTPFQVDASTDRATQDHLANTHHNLSVVLAERGQWQAAIYHARRAIVFQPSFVAAYCHLGSALIQQGHWQQAIEVLQQALLLQERGIATSPTIWANLHYSLGQALQFQSGLEPAIVSYRRALDYVSDNVQIYHSLGLALQQQNDHEQAIAVFRQALSLDPTQSNIEGDCGVSWLTLGHFSEAIHCFQRAIAPDQALIAAYGRGLSTLEQQSEQDDMSQARVAFSRFLIALGQYRPAAPIAHYLRYCLVQALFHWGNVLMDYGGYNQLRQAALHYHQAIQLAPDRSEFYLHLADCLLQQGKTDAAMTVYDQLQQRLETVINQNPESQSSSVSVVTLLEQSQRWQQAIAYYRWRLKLPRLNVSQATIVASKIPDPTVVSTTVADLTVLSTTVAHVIVSDADVTVGDVTETKLCEGLNCQPCLRRIKNWFEPIQLAPGIACLSHQTAPQLPETQLSDLTVTTISQGRVWTASKENAWKVCNEIAVFNSEGQLLPQFSRNYPGELPGCHCPSDLSRILVSVNTAKSDNTTKPKYFAGKVVVLTGLSGDVYFHWMVDILPRIEILRQNGIDLQQIDWFLVNSQQKSFQQETLKAFGIPAERVIEGDSYPYIQAEELIVPMFPGSLGWVQPWAIDTLRHHFLISSDDRNSRQNFPDKKYDSCYSYVGGQPDCDRQQLVRQLNSSYPRRIYITRTDAQYRRLLNEDAVIDLLVSSFQFVVLSLDQLTVAEQASLFSQAEIIAAPHGSGLTNLVFCHPGTKVIELVSPNYVRQYYWPISRQLQLEHSVVWGREFFCSALRQLMYPSPLMEDIWIDIDRLEQAVRFALSPQPLENEHDVEPFEPGPRHL